MDKGRWSGVGLGARVGGHVLVLFGGYDHYRPTMTMTHLRHGLLEERHTGRVTIPLGEVHGCLTVLLEREDGS